MKKKVSIFAMVTVLFGAMLTSSFVNPATEGKPTMDIPDALEAKVINVAQDNGLINADEARILIETNAVQQCVDAFMRNDFDPSAAVDKLAEISVEKGCFKSKAAAKKTMKSIIEKERKNEASWTKLFSVLGL